MSKSSKMNILFAFLSLVVFVKSGPVEVENIAYGYFEKYGIPAGRQIRKVEEQSRIAGGTPAGNEQFPWQAGLVIDVPEHEEQSVCGATLITDHSLLTAAHCYYDGWYEASHIEVVLGSSTLFYGGTRINMESIVVHQSWFVQLHKNDLAIIHLAVDVEISDTIAPISLPSGSLLDETFAGETAVATGFGLSSDRYPDEIINYDQALKSVELEVLPNNECEWFYPILLLPENLCTSAKDRVGPCYGDFGGPLVVNRTGKNVLIGVSSFRLPVGCTDPTRPYIPESLHTWTLSMNIGKLNKVLSKWEIFYCNSGLLLQPITTSINGITQPQFIRQFKDVVVDLNPFFEM